MTSDPLADRDDPYRTGEPSPLNRNRRPSNSLPAWTRRPARITSPAAYRSRKTLPTRGALRVTFIRWPLVVLTLLATFGSSSSSLLADEQFAAWRRALERGETSADRISALDSIAKASPAEATDLEVARALAKGLENEHQSVRVHAARLLGRAADESVALERLGAALRGSRSKLFKAHKALRALEVQRLQRVDHWWAVTNDPRAEPMAESAAYLAVLAAELAVLEDYLPLERRRDGEREFCVALCEGLLTLRVEVAAAHAELLSFHDKLASECTELCAWFAQPLLARGPQPAALRAVASTLIDNEALCARWHSRKEVAEAFERRRGAEVKNDPGVFAEVERKSCRWTEDLYEALVVFAHERSLDPLPKWNAATAVKSLNRWLPNAVGKLSKVPE